MFNNMATAEIQTPKGTMMVSFFEADAPATVENFITLAKKGYYDGLAFHRVIPDFVQSYLGLRTALGEPPSVGGAQNARIERFAEIGHLGDLPVGVLDEDLVALGDAELARRLRMDLQPRVGVQLTQPFDPAVRRMKEVAALGARQDERVCQVLRLGQSLVDGQRRELEFLGGAEPSSTLVVGVEKPFSSYFLNRSGPFR